jgi:hypothetical protein
MSKQKVIKLVDRSHGDKLAELTDEELQRLGELALQ